VYRAALQQFEELVRAAQSSGPASRPLPLFYALAQAGRAIVAVKGGPMHFGHGLALGDPQEDPLETTVRPGGQSKKGLGHFQAVAQAAGSPLLNDTVPIGAVIASLPELANVLLLHEDWPQALPIWERAWYKGLGMPGLTPVTMVIDQERVRFDDLLKLLADYPTVRNRITESKAVATLEALPTYATPEGQGVGALFQGDAADLETAAPQYRIAGRRWLRPSIAGSDPPTPIMTWWLLLYALSMYARYHPQAWVAALDVDSSPAAVTLERAMTRALDALPQLVLNEVLSGPILHSWDLGHSMDPFGRTL
jgi:hypothetical protein